jgi:hypothetical protein
LRDALQHFGFQSSGNSDRRALRHPNQCRDVIEIAHFRLKRFNPTRNQMENRFVDSPSSLAASINRWPR